MSREQAHSIFACWRWSLTCLIKVGMLALAGPAAAQIPANDFCAGAIHVNEYIVGGMYQSLPVPVVEASDDTDHDPLCDQPGPNVGAHKGVWWRYETGSQARRVVFAEPGPEDAVITLWLSADGGGCDHLTPLACSDAGNSTGERLEWNVPADAALFVLVSRWTFSPPGPGVSLTLSLAESALIAPPANDLCAEAVDLNALTLPLATENTFAFGTAAADTHMRPPCADPAMPCAAQGVWFVYTTGATGGLMEFAENGAEDVVFSLWTGSCDELALAACLDGGTNDIAHFAAQPMTAYRLLVSKRDTTRTGSSGHSPLESTITLGFNFTPGPPRPVNDDCAQATEIEAFPFASGPISTGGAADDPGVACDDPANTGAARGVWFTFTTTDASGSALVREQGSFDTVVSLWTGACDELNEVACDNVLVDGVQGWLAPLEPLARHWLLVSHRDQDVYSGGETLSVLIELVPTPSNDLCDGAIPLVTEELPRKYVIHNAFAAHDDVDPGLCTARPVGLNGVWWSFTPSSSGNLFIYESSAQDAVAGVFTGSCSALVSAGCLANESGALPLLGGVPYFIQISAETLTPISTPLEVWFAFFPAPVPNDECSGAIDLGVAGTRFISNRGATTSAASTLMCPTSVSVHNDVWYRWIAPADGLLGVTINSHPFPLSVRVAVYDGGAAGACPAVGAAPLGCVPGADQPVHTVISGRAYFLRVGSTGSGAFGEARLETRFLPASGMVGACCTGDTCAVTTQSACVGSYLGGSSVCATPAAEARTYLAPGIAIPDGQSGIIEGTAALSMPVSDDDLIADVEVQLAIAHGFVGDLTVTLSHAGTTVELLARPRRSAALPSGSNNNLGSGTTPGVYTFTDSAAQTIWDAAGSANTATVIPSGSYRPHTIANLSPALRSAFAGASSLGIWTLTVRDFGAGGAGTLASWTLKITPAIATPCGGPTTELCCRGTCCSVVALGTCPPNGSIPGVGSAPASGPACSASLVAGCCYADFGHSDGVSIDDLFRYLNAWFTGSPFASFGGDGVATPAIDDLFQYLNAWFTGCA